MKIFNYTCLLYCLLSCFQINNAAAQNVGIGTTAPLQKLHVEGSAYIKDSLGIGKNTPAARLDVYGTTIFRGNNSNSLNDSVRAAVEFFTGRSAFGNLPPGATLTDLAFDYAGPGGGFRHYLVSRHSNIGSIAQNALDFYINTSSANNGSTEPDAGNINMLSITDAGVGIGTKFPAQKLTVAGNAIITGKLSLGTNATVYGYTPTLNVDGSALFKGGNPAYLDSLPRAGVEFFFGRDAVSNVVPGGYQNADLAFNYGDNQGGFRHFLATRHYGGGSGLANSFDFYTNTSTNFRGSQKPGVGNKLAATISGAGINVPNGYIAVGTSLQAGERLYVNGDAKIETNMNVIGNLSVGNNVTNTQKLYVNGDAKIETSLTVSGTVNMGYSTQYQEFTVQAGTVVTLTIACPAGQQLISGGGGHRDYVNGAQDLELNYSGPDTGNPSSIWRLIMTNKGTNAKVTRIYCTCARIN